MSGAVALQHAPKLCKLLLSKPYPHLDRLGRVYCTLKGVADFQRLRPGVCVELVDHDPDSDIDSEILEMDSEESSEDDSQDD